MACMYIHFFLPKFSIFRLRTLEINKIFRIYFMMLLVWKWKSLSCVWLYNPMDCSPPGSSVHGILQATILEWVAFPFSRGSSQPRNGTQVSRIEGIFFTSWATREAQEYWSGWVAFPFSSRSSWSRNWTRVYCTAGGFFTNLAIGEAQYIYIKKNIYI